VCLKRLKWHAAGADGEMDAVGTLMDEDDDVAQERRRVLRGSGRRDLLQLKNLSKVITLSHGDDVDYDDDDDYITLHYKLFIVAKVKNCKVHYVQYDDDDSLQLTGDHYVGIPSATRQPTRPTQPFILPRSINEQQARLIGCVLCGAIC